MQLFLHLLEDVEIPKRTEVFIGRKTELKELSQRLEEENRVYVIGVGGVGKSELVQEYARKSRKMHKNLLYLTYQGSVRSTIGSVRMKGDALTSSGRNFERNLRLLRSLREDSLIIVDNLDELPEKSGDLAVLDKLRCKVIVTTRLKAWKRGTLFLDMMDNREELLELFYSYCPKNRAGEEEHVWDLIELVHRHTYAVQLLALTVREGYKTSAELAVYIREEGLAFSNDIFVETNKDGKYDWKPFYQLLDGLFRLQELNEKMQYGLINFSLMPESGIRKRQFMLWSQMVFETQVLVRLGWIQEDEETEKLYIHGLVREMVQSTFQPTLAQCEDTINAVLDTLEIYSKGFSVDKMGDINDVLGCIAYIQKVVQKKLLIVSNPYIILFSLYSARIAYHSIERQYCEKYGQDGELSEVNMLRMKQEQLNQLEPFIRDSKKYEKGLRDEAKWYQNGSEDFCALFDRAVEEWRDFQRLYQDCRSELRIGEQRASHGAKKAMTKPGKHAGGKVRSSGKKK